MTSMNTKQFHSSKQRLRLQMFQINYTIIHWAKHLVQALGEVIKDTERSDRCVIDSTKKVIDIFHAGIKMCLVVS